LEITDGLSEISLIDIIRPLLSSKHLKTRERLFAVPTLSNIKFGDIEGLIKARDGEVRRGDGSRVSFELYGGARAYLHRPHPGNQAKRYQVEQVREWLRGKGVTP
jgi:hypothetical protein